MQFKASGKSKEQNFNKETADWLKVADIDDRDNFTIMDEAKSGRSKYALPEEASALIKRHSDGKLFMKTFKEIELEKLTDAWGDSVNWIGKDVEIVILVSKKWNKPFLATNPIINMDAE